MTTSDPVKCWIDEQGIVWSHDCDHKATPATAIPNEVLEKVREEALTAWQQYDRADPMVKGECLREARERTALAQTRSRRSTEILDFSKLERTVGLQQQIVANFADLYEKDPEYAASTLRLIKQALGISEYAPHWKTPGNLAAFAKVKAALADGRCMTKKELQGTAGLRTQQLRTLLYGARACPLLESVRKGSYVVIKLRTPECEL